VPFTTFSELKTAIASKLHRDDLEDEIEDAIALAETEMQVDCKLVEFETDSSITITSGSGTLPTGFLGFRSVYWNGDTKQPLFPAAPGYFDALRNNTGGSPSVYVISGSTIRLNEEASGTAVGIARVRFTPLSDSNTSNDLLTNHPDAYLYGALKHMAIHIVDGGLLEKAGILFNAAKGRIKTNNQDRRYAGPLEVRAR
jgi:hypothetical protein